MFRCRNGEEVVTRPQGVEVLATGDVLDCQLATLTRLVGLHPAYLVETTVFALRQLIKPYAMLVILDEKCNPYNAVRNAKFVLIVARGRYHLE